MALWFATIVVIERVQLSQTNAISDPKVCEEKRKLMAAYQHVTEKYSAAVTELHRSMGTVSKREYDALYRATETLHAEVTRAQGQLNSHVVEHGC
jgi:hypothetical protein